MTAVVITIDDPGCYFGVPISRYHEQLCTGPSVSSSGLRALFAKSPSHFYAGWSGNPHAESYKETAEITLGRAAHHLLLGEDSFSTEFVARPEKWTDWKTDAAKEWKADQEKSGRTVLIHKQLEAIRGMGRALNANPIIQAGILEGDIEQSMFWKDKKTGLWLKSRPDAIPNDSGDFADLKTTSSIGWDIDKSIAKYRYDIQAALVRQGARETLGVEMQSFTLVFAETSPPYDIGLLTLKESDMDAADKDIRCALDVVAQCLETGMWWGSTGKADGRYVQFPSWARTEAENRRFFLQGELDAN
jgi:hypothetical protein